VSRLLSKEQPRDQGKFWELRNNLISNGTDPNHDAINKYAQSLGLEMSDFRSCVDGENIKARFRKISRMPTSLQISGAPTFVVGKTSNDIGRTLQAISRSPHIRTFPHTHYDRLITNRMTELGNNAMVPDAPLPAYVNKLSRFRPDSIESPTTNQPGCSLGTDRQPACSFVRAQPSL